MADVHNVACGYGPWYPAPRLGAFHTALKGGLRGDLGEEFRDLQGRICNPSQCYDTDLAELMIFGRFKHGLCIWRYIFIQFTPPPIHDTLKLCLWLEGEWNPTIFWCTPFKVSPHIQSWRRISTLLIVFRELSSIEIYYWLHFGRLTYKQNVELLVYDWRSI